MDETLSFFAQLLSMTRRMVDDIVPDLLIDSDRKMIERLVDGAQKVDTSLQMFIKLCHLVLQQPQSPQGSSGVDNKSIVTDFSNLTTNDDKEREEENGNQGEDTVWKGLLTEARNWYLTHDKQQIPQVYYCGVCNKHAKAKHIWEAHLDGKNHLKLLEDVFAMELVCDVCDLHVCGEFPILRVVIDSDEHNAFDLAIKENQKISAAHSTVAGCFGKGSNPKKENADSPNNPNVSNRNPLISAPSSTEINSNKLVFQDPKPILQNRHNESKVIFQNTEIHTDFVDITDRIAGYLENHEPYTIAYCRPCEVICESEPLWNEHKITRHHMSKMGAKNYRNVLCRCLQCDFIVTAGSKIAITYMKFHIENGHRQSTEGIKNEEYMEIKDLFLGAKIQKTQTGSMANSFKGSSETIYSVRSCVADLRSSSAGLQSSSAGLQSSSADLRSCVAPTQASRAHANASVPDASSRHRQAVDSFHSSLTDLRCSSADLQSSSPDMRLFLDRKRASRAEAASSTRSQDVGSQNAEQYADKSVSASSSCISTRTTKNTSANPYRSSNTNPPSVQVSDQGKLPAQVPPPPALIPLTVLVPLPAQFSLHEQNDAPPVKSTALPGDLEFTFLKMLSRKEESFRKDTTFKLFTAMCLVCKTADFPSRRAWARHLKSHKPTDSIVEVPCLQCNTCFFGDVGDIYTSFIGHDYHGCIDAMFSW